MGLRRAGDGRSHAGHRRQRIILSQSDDIARGARAIALPIVTAGFRAADFGTAPIQTSATAFDTCSITRPTSPRVPARTVCSTRAGEALLVSSMKHGRSIYAVDMGRRIGFVGGQAGAAAGNPTASHVQLVLQGNDVITAFPVIP